MKFLVCLKQVPHLDRVRFDRANRVVREDVPALCNPLDVRALGHALELAAEADEVVAVTMGPPAARAVLDEAARCGATRALHLCDRRFKGADTLATARALAAVVDREEPDLVLFGRGTLDGATAQLGQQVAELAGTAQSTEVVGTHRADGALSVERETGYGREHGRLPLPAAVTVARGPVPPETAEQRAADITEVTAEDLGGEPTGYGTRGSPTFVKEVRAHGTEPRGEPIATAAEAAGRVRELVAGAPGAEDAEPWQPHPAPCRDVWVLAERDGEGLDPVSFEGLACARRAAAPLAARVTAVLLAADDGGASTELAARGADRVLHVRHPRLRDYTTAAHTDALAAVVAAEQPAALVAPWTIGGRDHVPRVAARLGLGLTGDVTGVEVEAGERPRIGWVKPAWAGTADALVISRTTPTVATLRPGAYRPLARRTGVEAEVETVEGAVVEPSLGPAADEPRSVSAFREVDDCLLDRASVVFCLGDELSADAAAEVLQLAAHWCAGVGGTAGAVHRGLVPPQWEVGMLKRSLAPAVCVALGVREAREVLPVRGASALVTVHPDPEAAAHRVADLPVAAEGAALVAELREQAA